MTTFVKLGVFSGSFIVFGTFMNFATAQPVEAPCIPKHHFSTLVPGTLKVAYTPFWPTIDVKNGKLIGFEGQLLNEFAKMECLKTEVEKVTASEIIPAVQAKRDDVGTGGWFRSKRRMEIVAMSYPTMISELALMSKAGFKTFAEAKGHTVGTIKGNLWVPESQAYYGDDFKIYQTNDQLYADLRAGRLDACIVDYALAKQVVNDQTVPGATFVVPKGIPQISSSMKPAQVAFPTIISNKEFTAAMDDDIKLMHASGFVTKALESVKLSPALEKTGAPDFLD